VIDPPNDVAQNEKLARCCFSSSSAQAARNKRKRAYNIFVPKKPDEGKPVKISVDRFSLAGENKARALGTVKLRKRQEEGTAERFYGWFIIKTHRAEKHNRSVEADKLPDNVFHANIVLPKDNDPPDEEPVVFHAQQLAKLSEWQGIDPPIQ